MSSIETICRSASALSDVQIHILKNSEDLLQFASDLSSRQKRRRIEKKPEQSAPGTKNRSCCRYCRRGR